MTTLIDYISKIRSEGYRSFTANQVAQALNITPKAVILKCMRLKNKGELLSPVKGLYIPIPAEHQKLGTLPLEELIPLVMDFLKIEYYVCLLSAALYHGASHQKPQVYQIMTNYRGVKINAGKMKIDLIYKKNLKNLPVIKTITKTGYLQVSTPELTLVDLLLYPKPTGGLNTIATVLTELIEVIDANKLILLSEAISHKIWIQRLGYILEHIDSVDKDKQLFLIDKLEKHVSSNKYSYIPLSPELPIKGCERDKKWKIIINATIEADE